MERRRFGLAALALGALASGVPIGLAAQATERSIYVSVIDDHGVPVPDLGPPDFRVREDSVAREILRVAPATAPIHLAVLVDNSQAAAPFIVDIRNALTELVGAMIGPTPGQRNLLALISLAERPTILTDYTASATELEKGIGRIFPLSGTGSYLLDGLIEVSRGFRRREAERPAILVITAEGPELSGRSYPAVLDPIMASRATLHVVVVGRPSSTSMDRTVVLAKGTEDTGGRYETVLASSALPGRLKALAADLTSQYLVTYGRPPTLIPPGRIAVEATRPRLVARVRPVLEPARTERP